MDTALLALNSLLLLGILLLLLRNSSLSPELRSLLGREMQPPPVKQEQPLPEREEQPPPGKEGQPPPERKGPGGYPHIAEVLRRERGEMIHHSWVRTHSNAWRMAHDTPGLFLRTCRGEIIEGVQEEK